MRSPIALSFCLIAVWLALVPPVRELVAAEPPVTALAFAPDGRSVLVGSQRSLIVHSWPDLAPGRPLAVSMSGIHDLAFSPKGDLLAVGGGSPGESGAVALIRWPEGSPVFRDEPHDDLVYALAWRGDGAAWASASLDRTVQVHDLAGETTRVLEGHSRGVLGVCYLGDGRRLVTAGIDRSLRVWDPETGRMLRSLENHTGTVHGLALRPGQPAEAPAVVASIGADRTVRLWQPAIGRMLRLARLESEPLAVAWTPDGRTIGVACADGHLRVIDPETVAILGDVPAVEGRAFSLAAAPDGRAWIVGGAGGRLAVLHESRVTIAQ